MATLKNTIINDTGYFTVPVGTTGQRPANPLNGMMRYNTTTQTMETYVAGLWSDLKTIPADIVTTNLILWLDAGNTSSYSGTGTIWNDLSGNNNNFNIVAGAYQSTGVKYMDFNGSYGIAKNSADISINDSTGVTFCVWTRVKNSSADWRTLARSYSADHHVIIQYQGWDIGMYDNNSAGFISSGFSQQNLPNYNTTNWIAIYWRWQSSSPYYEMSYNDTPGTIRGSITNANGRFNRGFGSIGGYHNENSSPSSASQFWGDISVFMMYNRRLTDAELLLNYNYYKTRFGN
jgi:hypothetical protein